MPRKNENLIMQTVGEEIVVLNKETNSVHCLDSLASAVFQSCDEHLSIESAAKRVGVTESVVQDKLSGLAELGLVEGQMGRRDFCAHGGAASVLVACSVLLPSPAAAQSSCSPCDALAGCLIGACPCGSPCDTGTGCTKACVRCFDVVTDVEFDPTLAFCCSPGVGSGLDCNSAATDPGSCASAKTLAQGNGKGFYCCCP